MTVSRNIALNVIKKRENVLHVIDTYVEKMMAFRKAIDEGDDDEVRMLIEEANRIRRIIR